MKKTLVALSLILFLAASAGAWRFFTRTPPAPALDEPTISLTFLGDLGLGLAVEAGPWIAEHGWHHAFDPIRESWRGKDFLIGNLEGPIVPDDYQPTENHRRPHQPPEVAAVFAQEGFTAMSLANNHQMDFGPRGLAFTIDALRAAGIRPFGAGPDFVAATEPLVLEKNGIRVAVVTGCNAFTPRVRLLAESHLPGVAPLQSRELRRRIRRAHKLADVVIFFPHWGKNYIQTLTDKQLQTAIAAIDGGANLIVGHHPHVAQKVGFVHGVLVLNSIGNSIFQAVRQKRIDRSLAYDYALVTTVDVARRGVRRVTLDPYFTHEIRTDLRPRPATAREAKRLFRKILDPIRGRWHWDGTAAVIDL